jgi:type IV secretory pathway VirB10-like protein
MPLTTATCRKYSKAKMGEFELTAGSVIPAVMLSGIHSDLPGTIVAQTRQTVLCHK